LPIRRLTAAALGVLALAAPASGWEYEERTPAGGTLAGAWQDADSGSGHQLAVVCDDAYPEPDLYLFTPDPASPAPRQSADFVPLTVIVDGAWTGALSARLEDSQGAQSVAVHAYEEDRLGPLLRRMERAGSGIEVRYRNDVLAFGIDEIGPVMSRLIGTCSVLAARRPK
jgi:hypothetical protein